MILKNISWRFKLISLFTVILLASMVVQIFYGIPYIRNREIENAKLYQEEIANNIARELDVGLNRIKDRLQRMSILPEFRNMDINAMQNILLEQEIISERISSIAVMNHEGRFVCGTIIDFSVFTNKSYAHRPYFSIPFNEGKTHFTSPRYYANENLIAFSICIPIESESGDRVGVLMGGMDLADIIKRVTDYPLAIDRTACIISNKGTVVAHSGIDLYALKDGPLSLSLDCDFIQMFLAGEMDIPMKHAHEGTDFNGSYTLLESTKWGVIVEVPMKSILAQSNMFYNKIVFFEILIFIIALIITIVLARQITEAQRKTDKMLLKSEEKYRTLIENSPDTQFRTSIEGNIIYMTPSFYNKSGYTEEEVAALKMDDFYLFTEERNKMLSILQENGSVNNFEAQLKGKDDSIWWASINAHHYIDKGGNILGSEGTVRDITESKHAEEEIKEKSKELEKQFQKSEEQRVVTLSVLSDLNETTKNLKLEITERKLAEQIQKTLYNISNAVITTKNVEELINQIQIELGTIIDTTNFFVAFYNNKTDMLSLPYYSDEKDSFTSVSAIKTLTKYVIDTKKPLLADIKLKKRLVEEGVLIHQGSLSKLWMGVPLKTEGKVTGVLAVQSYTDENAFSESDMKMLEFVSGQISISIERKKAEEELKTALEKAQESDRLKSAFLTNMSHEIRTPMNGILGFTGLLKDPQLTGDEKEEYIKIIEKSGDRMLNTITDIIDISRIEAGQVEVVNTEVSINEIFAEQYAFFNLEAQSKGLELNYKPTLSDKEAVIVTDKHKLEGILTNLIKNAIKFTKHGNISFGYSLKKEKNFEGLEFFIKDTGIGIPSNRIHAVFNRFEQADIEDTQVFEGSGLGLAISKSYAEMLGGNISVTSEEGIGSTFVFSIPYTKPSTKENDAEGGINKIPQISLNKLSVIVAEDDKTSRIFLEAILENEFHKIIYTKTGKETVDKFRENPETNIILMDIKMHNMNGYEATREIRKFNQDVVIIAQTAYGLSGDREKAIEAGCDDYISKPIKKELLCEKIMLHLSKRSI